MEIIKKLISEALIARKSAYTPYSKFKVGAALLTSTEKIYSGFNIECAAYSMCNCAERTAIFRAVFDNHRKFTHIAIVGGPENQENLTDFCPPCGACRQVLREFCDPKELKIILAKNTEEYKIFTLDELFLFSFGPQYL